MSNKIRKFSLMLLLLLSVVAYSQQSSLQMKAIGKIGNDDKLKIELKNISKDTLKVLGNLYLDSRSFLGLKTSGFDYSYIKDCEEDNNRALSYKVAELPHKFGEFDEKLIILAPNSSQNIDVWLVGGKRVCRNSEQNKLKIIYKVELSNDFNKTYETEKNNFNEKIDSFDKKFSVLKNKASANDIKELSYLLNDLIQTKKIIEGLENLEEVASQHIQAETEYVQL